MAGPVVSAHALWTPRPTVRSWPRSAFHWLRHKLTLIGRAIALNVSFPAPPRTHSFGYKPTHINGFLKVADSAVGVHAAQCAKTLAPKVQAAAAPAALLWLHNKSQVGHGLLEVEFQDVLPLVEAVQLTRHLRDFIL